MYYLKGALYLTRQEISTPIHTLVVPGDTTIKYGVVSFYSLLAPTGALISSNRSSYNEGVLR